jgi:hypothetical protein
MGGLDGRFPSDRRRLASGSAGDDRGHAVRRRYIASDLYNAYSSVNPGSSTVELTNSGLWGVRLTASSFRGGIEFAYTRSGSDIKLDHTLSGQPRTTIGRLDLDSYDINFLGYQPSGNPRVMPFGIVGFGWTVTHPDVNRDFTVPGSGPQPKSNTLFKLQLRARLQGGDEREDERPNRRAVASHRHEHDDEQRNLVRPLRLLLLVRHRLVQQWRADRWPQLRVRVQALGSKHSSSAAGRSRPAVLLSWRIQGPEQSPPAQKTSCRPKKNRVVLSWPREATEALVLVRLLDFTRRPIP